MYAREREMALRFTPDIPPCVIVDITEGDGRSRDDDGLVEVLQHERKGAGRVRHRVRPVQHNKPVIVIVRLCVWVCVSVGVCVCGCGRG